MPLPYQKVMVPLDGSSVADQALPVAQELIQQSGAKVILFRVVPDLSAKLAFSPGLSVTSASEQHEEHVNDAMTALERKVDDLSIHDIDAEAVVDVGDPAEKIVDYAADNDVDLIVMSTHGRTGVARWAYGSVARKVMDSMPCSMFLVRASLD
jgi:nucleotide-binding universal stress UspA family protein